MTRHRKRAAARPDGRRARSVDPDQPCSHEPASHVARAKSLLAVADGKHYTEAAQAAGDVLVMRSPNWSPVSTRRVWRRLPHGMAAVRADL